MQISNLKGTPIEILFNRFDFSIPESFVGLSGILAPMVLARIAEQPGVKLLIVSSDKRAKELQEQVQAWLAPNSKRVMVFLSERKSIYDQTSADSEILTQRLSAISAGFSGGLVIASPGSLSERFYKPKEWIDSCFTVRVDEELSRSELIERLIKLGYKRVNTVAEIGQFAVRGSLIDIFSSNMENPVRLDFFGDDLEEIKAFSVETQRTIDRKKQARIIPVYEFLPDEKLSERILESVQLEINKMDKQLGALLERRLEHFLSHSDSRDFRELAPFSHVSKGFIWDFWENFEVFAEDYDQVEELLKDFYSGQEAHYKKDSVVCPLKSPDNYYHPPEDLLAFLEELETINFSRFGQEDNPAVSKFESHTSPSDTSRETLINELKSLLIKQWAVAIIIENENRFHNLKGLLGERKVPIHSSRIPTGLKFGSVIFIKGSGRKGFKDHYSKVAVFTEEDIYLGQAKDTGRRKHASQQQIMAISQMVPGDVVVHADHGVAEFRGIQTMKAGAHTREYLLLQYAGTDKLYVPTDQVHKVSKYIGMEGVSPRIHSLNSKIWVNQKRRVSKNVEAIAKELLQLYAKRHAGVGFAFNQDCDLQRSMENQFPFAETPDQMKAIVSTKEDMETEVPMDRLICGDVGYGKTEVAMRAAFKSVCSGRQVAFLAPTTLLAFQHYQTFKKRMGDFPVSIDMVSRLRKPAEQRETIRKLKEGSLDILIGTHRLLSKDIEFSRLGLLIVDEEQRFGVKHKERLKQLKTNIDVLTLTATPIPRTMQMAMAGIRQISVIDTPPRDRRPIQTYVAPFDPSWIKRAIIDEMKRGGQVFYVFNRVEQIEQKAAFLRELVPEARIEIAHGQMAEQKVEKTMLSFIKREFDVLIATTIIESGLDIPNANTLIVDDAQRLGLSQMYQLRGRVGRSNRQAWAYFFYSKGKKLTKEAKERLETIEEHTSLGSGFKIALRDLQIRGAGNILGSSQSGHISSIGFTLYMELLEEAVSKLKGVTPASPKVESAVEIPITALFPHSYIADEETRVELYARLSRCFELDAIDLIKAECEDRFGPLPDDSRGLFIITTLRILASKAGIGKITRIMTRLRFELAKNRKPDMASVMASGANFVRQMTLNPKDPEAIFLELRSEKIEDIYLLSKDFLTTLADIPDLEDTIGVN